MVDQRYEDFLDSAVESSNTVVARIRFFAGGISDQSMRPHSNSISVYLASASTCSNKHDPSQRPVCCTNECLLENVVPTTNQIP